MQLRNRYVPSVYDKKPSYVKPSIQKRYSNRKQTLKNPTVRERKVGYDMRSTIHRKPTYETIYKNYYTLDETFRQLRKINEENYAEQIKMIEQQQDNIIEKINKIKKNL